MVRLADSVDLIIRSSSVSGSQGVAYRGLGKSGSQVVTHQGTTVIDSGDLTGTGL